MLKGIHTFSRNGTEWAKAAQQKMEDTQSAAPHVTLVWHLPAFERQCIASNIMASIHFSDEVLHSRERSHRLSLRGMELLAEAKSSRLNCDEVHLKHEQTLVPLAGSACVSGNTQAAGKRRRDGWTSRAASGHSSISFPPTLIPHQDWSLATITPTLIQRMQRTHGRFILDLFTQNLF